MHMTAIVLVGVMALPASAQVCRDGRCTPPTPGVKTLASGATQLIDDEKGRRFEPELTCSAVPLPAGWGWEEVGGVPGLRNPDGGWHLEPSPYNATMLAAGKTYTPVIGDPVLRGLWVGKCGECSINPNQYPGGFRLE